MPSGLPIWNKEGFNTGAAAAAAASPTATSTSSPPPSTDSWGSVTGAVDSNNQQLSSAKSLVTSMAGSLDQLKDALGSMNLENILNGLNGIGNGVGDLRTLIIALRSELRQCCGRIDSLVAGQNKLITKTTGLEITSGSSNAAWMTRLSFGLSIATLLLLLVVIFMMSRNCRR